MSPNRSLGLTCVWYIEIKVYDWQSYKITNMLKNLTGLIIVMACSSAVNAIQTDRSERKKVVQVVSNYARGIGCNTFINEKLVARLDSNQDKSDRHYVAFWTGDIECQGGTNSVETHIAIIGRDEDGRLYVRPQESSPIVKLVSPARYVQRIVKNTASSITIEGLAYHPVGKRMADPHCCPSRITQFTLVRDEYGNWAPDDGQTGWTW